MKLNLQDKEDSHKGSILFPKETQIPRSYNNKNLQNTRKYSNIQRYS